MGKTIWKIKIDDKDIKIRKRYAPPIKKFKNKKKEAKNEYIE